MFKELYSVLFKTSIKVAQLMRSVRIWLQCGTSSENFSFSLIPPAF